MDWCYAIGCEEIGDMPCDYCTDVKKKIPTRAEAVKVGKWG